MSRKPNRNDVESGVKHHVFRHEEPGVVDHPFDEGGSEELVVGQVSDVLFCWERNFGETGVVGDPVEKNHRHQEHDWRKRTMDC